MPHKIKGRKLNRTSSDRQAMFANMAVAVVMNEQIKTTLPKATWQRPFIEVLVTKAKKSDLAARRKERLLQKLKIKLLQKSLLTYLLRDMIVVSELVDILQ